jgi:phosphatidylglycerol lysyltransferase
LSLISIPFFVYFTDYLVTPSVQILQIGEEAIVDLKNFTLQGKANQKLRNYFNRLNKEGYRVEFYHPPIQDKLLNQLQEISDEWLQMSKGAEKHFSVGWFDKNYLRECPIAAVHTPKAQISAFANIVSEYCRNEITRSYALTKKQEYEFEKKSCLSIIA